MSRYRHSAVKPVSPMKKYDFLREEGIMVPAGPNGELILLKKQRLDDYVNEAIWRKKHPGQDPVREWD